MPHWVHHFDHGVGRKIGAQWEDWWKSDEAELIHFIGKDNIVFHCLIFPILLREHGGYILPSNVPANAFMNLEGTKFPPRAIGQFGSMNS